MKTWYKKAQEEDEDWLKDSFHEFVADEENKIKQGDLKSWPDGEWLGKTVTDAIVERANKLLSKSGMVVPETYLSEVVIWVKNALGNSGLTKDKYLNKMAGLLAVSVMFGQSMDSVEISLTSDKECDVYTELIQSGRIKNKQDLRDTREIYIEKFQYSKLGVYDIAGFLGGVLLSKKSSSKLTIKKAAGNPRFSYSPDAPELIKGVKVDGKAIDHDGASHNVSLYISDSGTADLIVEGILSWPWVRLTNSFVDNVLHPVDKYRNEHASLIRDCKKYISNLEEVVPKAMEAYQYFNDEVTKMYDDDVAEAMATRIMNEMDDMGAESSSRPRIKIAEGEPEVIKEDEI